MWLLGGIALCGYVWFFQSLTHTAHDREQIKNWVPSAATREDWRRLLADQNSEHGIEVLTIAFRGLALYAYEGGRVDWTCRELQVLLPYRYALRNDPVVTNVIRDTSQKKFKKLLKNPHNAMPYVRMHDQWLPLPLHVEDVLKMSNLEWKYI